jgi:hypothetical protein
MSFIPNRGFMASNGNQDSPKDEGPGLFTPVYRRLTKPVKQLSFWVVLVLGIIVLGYLAVMIEAVRVAFAKEPDFEPLKLAYATAILAVGAPCQMQLILGQDKMLRVLAIVLIFLNLALAYCVGSQAQGALWVNVSGLIGLLIATCSWWLANGEDELFQDRPAPAAPSGGDTSRELSGGSSGVKI